MLKAFAEASGAVITARPWLVIAACLILTAALAPGIFLIEIETGQESLLPSDSQVLVENERYQSQFGGDTMQLLFEGDRDDILAPANLRLMQDLADELSQDDRYLAVYSPATYLQVAADQAQGRLDEFDRQVAAAQEEAREAVAAAGGTPEEQEAAAGAAAGPIIQEFLDTYAAEAEQFAGIPAEELNHRQPRLHQRVLFLPEGDLRPQFADLLPDDRHALLVARINGNLTLDEVAEVAGDFERVTGSYEFQNVEFIATGSPELIDAITSSLKDSLLYTGLLAAALMVVVLAVVFRAHWRLLSLPIMVMGVVWAFGLMGYLGIPLTIVTVAGLPIMIGLGVDFAIQFHNRYQQQMRSDETTPEAMRSSLRVIGPGVTLAMLVTAYGFMALFVSDVPMVRDFATIHAVGVSLAFAAALLGLNSVLVVRDKDKTPEERRKVAGPERSPVDGILGFVARAAIEHPIPLIAFALAFFFLGIYVDDEIDIQTDPERYVPAESSVIQDLNVLRGVVGSTGDIGLMVENDELLTPEFLGWLQGFEREQLEQHPQLLKGASSPASTVAQLNGGEIPANAETIRDSLAELPPPISRTLISEDGTRGNLLFVTANIPLEEIERILDDMHAELDPPPDTETSFGGISVVGAETITSLADSRRLMTFAALAGILDPSFNPLLEPGQGRHHDRAHRTGRRLVVGRYVPGRHRL